MKTLVPELEQTDASPVAPQEPAAGGLEGCEEQEDHSQALCARGAQKGGYRGSSGSLQGKGREGTDGGYDDAGDQEESDEGEEGDGGDDEREEYSETPSIRGGDDERRAIACSKRGRGGVEAPARASGEGTETLQEDDEEAHSRLGGDTLPYQRQSLCWDDDAPPRAQSFRSGESQWAQSQGTHNLSQVLDQQPLCDFDVVIILLTV